MRPESRPLLTCSVLVITLFCLLAGLLMPGQPVRAQDGGGDTGDIYHVYAEVLFPAVIRFYVGINVPLEEVVSATLTVRQASGMQAVVTLDTLADFDETTGESTELVYDYLLGSETVPVPFEPVEYRWEVETASGQVSHAADEVLFEDTQRGTWKTAGQPPLILFWTHNLAGKRIQGELMAAYDQLTRRTGQQGSFQFAIYAPDAQLCQEVRDPETKDMRSVVISTLDETPFPCSPEAYQQVYDRAGIEFVRRLSLGYAELEDLLVEHMARRTYRALWQDAPVPAWFETGLAALYRLRPTYSAIQIARGAASTDALHPLAALAAGLPADALYPDRALWEAESTLMVLFLADRYGAETPFEIARRVPQVGSFETALRAATGLDSDTLWNDWSEWLLLRAAEDASAWTPYLATTPTPTATPTATAVPPTRTPTATPTITPTPTSTFLGDQPATVVRLEATPTPARTVRPTNTPLPPGSLPTVTSVPAPPPDTTGDDTTRTVIVSGAIAVGVGALLVLGLLIFAARRQ